MDAHATQGCARGPRRYGAERQPAQRARTGDPALDPSRQEQLGDRNHPGYQAADGQEAGQEDPAQAQRPEPHARRRQGAGAAHPRYLKYQGADRLTYPATRILTAWLATMVVQGSAAAAAPEAHGQHTAAQVRWKRSDRGDHGDRGALHRLLARLLHSAPAPVPEPGDWALVVAGLIGAGAIARGRVSLMRDRNRVVPRPSDAPRSRPQKITYCLASLLLL